VLGDADLLEIVATLRATRGFAGGLHGRQQERDQNRDNRNHNQQFDQSETSTHSRHEMKPFQKERKKKVSGSKLRRRTAGPHASFMALIGPYLIEAVCRALVAIDKVSLKKCDFFRTQDQPGSGLRSTHQLGKTLGREPSCGIRPRAGR
jgi:hypothetical protein